MAGYLSFVGFATLIVLVPGPDVLITLRSAIVGGRRLGLATAAGVSSAGAVQGVLAALGLGAVIVHAEPVFQAIRWAGVAYLFYLGVTALRAAHRGVDPAIGGGSDRGGSRVRAYRAGFLCNITNPKVLMFNLAVLPQFVPQHAGVATLLAFALTLAVLGGLFLVLIVFGAERAGAVLRRRRVRSGVDTVGGLAMLGFGAKLALEG